MTIKGQSTLPPDAVDGQIDDEPTPEWLLKPERPVSRYPDWLDGVDGVWKKIWSTWDYWLYEEPERGVEEWTNHEGLDSSHGRVLVVQIVMAKSALDSEHCAMEAAQRAARTAYQAVVKRQHDLERARYEVTQAEKAYARLTRRGP